MIILKNELFHAISLWRSEEKNQMKSLQRHLKIVENKGKNSVRK